MEDYYMKGFFGRREWCSDKVQLKSYFKKYMCKLSKLSKKKITDLDIMQHLVPQSNQLSEEELSTLTECINGEQLTTLYNNDLNNKSLKMDSTNGPSTSKSTGDTDDFDILKTKLFEDKRRTKNRISSEAYRAIRREVRLDAARKCGTKDLISRKHFMISFRIHEPFSHSVGDNSRPGRCTQQVSVLNSQYLSDLKDKIICESDFQDTRGDISERPEAPDQPVARDMYTSSMFYFDNTFYVDFRLAQNVDYSRPIKQWAMGRDIKLGETLPMDYTKVEDLEIRFGYPYLFMHQGCCEHIIVINDARLLTSKDSLYSLDYPLMVKITHNNMIYCMTCSRFPARWIVRESDRLAHDPSYMCKPCFKMLHYINGKKVQHFKAFPFWQRSSIL